MSDRILEELVPYVTLFACADAKMEFLDCNFCFEDEECIMRLPGVVKDLPQDWDKLFLVPAAAAGSGR